MLKDVLLEWCENQYDPDLSGHCGVHCSNQKNCTGNCDDCLDQVHWYPSSNGRADYTCQNLMYAYVLRFTEKYSQQIATALSTVDLSEYPYFNFFRLAVVQRRTLWHLKKLSGIRIFIIKAMIVTICGNLSII